MATPTESQAWRTILGLLVPAAVLGTVLGLWQVGVFGGRARSPVAEVDEARRTTAAVDVKLPGVGLDETTSTVTDDQRSPVRSTLQDVPAVADADELAEESALQQAVAQEQADGG